MSPYTQADRPLSITTPLGEDVLLLTGMRGHEAISQLFNFQVDLLGQPGCEIRFDAIIGQSDGGDAASRRGKALLQRAGETV